METGADHFEFRHDKTCAHPGCNKGLSPGNSSGVCGVHQHKEGCRCGFCVDQNVTDAEKQFLRHRRNFRDVALAMKPLQAVDYLLRCVDDLLDAQNDSAHEVDEAFGAFLQPVIRRIWIYLVDANGGVRSLDQIADAAYFDWAADDRPTENTIRKNVQRAMQFNDPSFGKIINVWGIGYRFVRMSNR